MTGRVEGVQTGQPAEHEWLGRTVRTSIVKSPASGRVAIRTNALDGDVQSDTARHGGPDRAVYAYAAEDSAWWEQRLGRTLHPGAFGENLTLTGVDVTAAVVGEQWRVGTALLAVTQPRLPCAKLGLALGDRSVPARFATAGRPGAYLRVVEQGDVAVGDPVARQEVPDHGVTVGDALAAYFAPPPVRGELASRLLAARELPARWRAWALDTVR